MVEQWNVDCVFCKRNFLRLDMYLWNVDGLPYITVCDTCNEWLDEMDTECRIKLLRKIKNMRGIK